MTKWANLPDKNICNMLGRIKIQEYQKTNWELQASLNSCWMFCIFNCKPQCVKHSSRGFLVIAFSISLGCRTAAEEMFIQHLTKPRFCAWLGLLAVGWWGQGCPGCRTQPYLSGEAPPQVHGTRASFVGLQPQHHCGGQLVMGSAATGLLLQVQENKKGQAEG